MRKLASVQKIIDIKPIDGADAIECAYVLGWQVVIKKGDFKTGDPVVYVEIDSKLPDKPEFEFMRARNFKVKTIKLRGCLSQGIIFPMDILPIAVYKEDDDVTDIIGVKQYDKDLDEVEFGSSSNGNNSKYKNKYIKKLLRYKFFRDLLLPSENKEKFPSFISRTEELRIQNKPSLLNDKETEYIVTEKLDGTSLTIFMKRLPRRWYQFATRYDFGVCSRNLRLPESDVLYWCVAKKYRIHELLMDTIQTMPNVDFAAIQGEIIAPKVQGNKYQVTEPQLYVFNFITNRGKHSSGAWEKIVRMYGMNWVPILDNHFTMPDTMEELLKYAEGKSQLCDVEREGIVCRNYEKDISFKVISNKFLLKNNE